MDWADCGHGAKGWTAQPQYDAIFTHRDATYLECGCPALWRTSGSRRGGEFLFAPVLEYVPASEARASCFFFFYFVGLVRSHRPERIRATSPTTRVTPSFAYPVKVAAAGMSPFRSSAAALPAPFAPPIGAGRPPSEGVRTVRAPTRNQSEITTWRPTCANGQARQLFLRRQPSRRLRGTSCWGSTAPLYCKISIDHLPAGGVSQPVAMMLARLEDRELIPVKARSIELRGCASTAGRDRWTVTFGHGRCKSAPPLAPLQKGGDKSQRMRRKKRLRSSDRVRAVRTARIRARRCQAIARRAAVRRRVRHFASKGKLPRDVLDHDRHAEAERMMHEFPGRKKKRPASGSYGSDLLYVRQHVRSEQPNGPTSRSRRIL